MPTEHITWSDPARQSAFGRWLASLSDAQELKLDSLRPASADASFRRYFRIDTPTGSRIIMDAPPASEDCQPFVRVAGLMRAAGLRVPDILSWDQEAGFMLLSDLGHQTMLETLALDHPERNLGRYLQAVDALLAWQLASRPGELPAYDESLLRREIELFPEWYLHRHLKQELDPTSRGTLDAVFSAILADNLATPLVYVHRDFMPRNLMVGPDQSDPVLGVLDFQDAVYGPITYDIASLMRDAFVSWEEEFVLEVTVRYWEQARRAGLPVGDDFGGFYRSVEWMGLQRHLKVAGIFARLTLRDGKPKYLADTPRFIRYIRATASRYRELTPLLRLIDRIEGIEQPVGLAFGRV